jgi:hypothetical protein
VSGAVPAARDAAISGLLALGEKTLLLTRTCSNGDSVRTSSRPS